MEDLGQRGPPQRRLKRAKDGFKKGMNEHTNGREARTGRRGIGHQDP
jgi:hypothetical protein